MADTTVIAATEQGRVGGGADMDGNGFQESYDDESYYDDHDDDYDDTCGGGGECGGASKKEAESTAGHTSPLPQPLENENEADPPLEQPLLAPGQTIGRWVMPRADTRAPRARLAAEACP